MADLRLIQQYINLYDTRQLDDLHDILTDDFYYKSPKIEIFGKNKYIQYVKDSDSVFTTDTTSLSKKQTGLYIHQYVVTMYDSLVKLNDQIQVVEQVQITDGLISASIIDYELSTFSSSAKELLQNTVKNHGRPVKK